jgi:hypothetical protein
MRAGGEFPAPERTVEADVDVARHGPLAGLEVGGRDRASHRPVGQREQEAAVDDAVRIPVRLARLGLARAPSPGKLGEPHPERKPEVAAPVVGLSGKGAQPQRGESGFGRRKTVNERVRFAIVVVGHWPSSQLAGLYHSVERRNALLDAL